MSQDVLRYLSQLHDMLDGGDETLILSTLFYPLWAIYKCEYQRQWRHWPFDSEGRPVEDHDHGMVMEDIGPAYNVLPVQIRLVPEGIHDKWRTERRFDETTYESYEVWPYTTPANYFAFLLDKGAEGDGNGDFFTGHIINNEGTLSFVVDYMNTSLK